MKDMRLLVCELLALRAQMRRVASIDTCYDSRLYTPDRPALTGHCFVASQVVRERYGGTLMVGTVEWEGRTETHYWNRLPDGTEIDLTSDQYGGGGFLPVTSGIPSPLTGKQNPRLRRFRHALGEVLAEFTCQAVHTT